MDTINAEALKKAFLQAAGRLEANKDWINELNVFPVPDGDTGTNMTMTIMSAAQEVEKLQDPDIKSLSRAMSSGSLRGARGNSGVILSQLLRGFTKEIETASEINTHILAMAFTRGTETAYKAVIKPKEGTILTVARGMAQKAMEISGDITQVEEFARIVIEHGDFILSQTPEMLPVLKQAGVVDSGGQGLMQVLKGALEGLSGGYSYQSQTVEKSAPVPASFEDIETAEITYGYCTEFIINLEKPFTEQDEQSFKEYLLAMGDSLVVVADDEIVKVHVHTNHPGLAFEKGLEYGSLSRMKVDNMREEHNERVIMDAERLSREQAAAMEGDKETAPVENKPFGFISVSSGDGLRTIFEGIGADFLIEGGQTMNPSTQDMLDAIGCVKADTIFIFPNNKNIILAAAQARDLTEDKKVFVVESKTIPQGITALINFVPELSAEENFEAMTEEMSRVKTAQITYAVRDSLIGDVQVLKGDIMAMGDEGILSVGKTVTSTALSALKAMLDEECELVTLYYGADVPEADAQELLKRARVMFPDKEFELQYGGQPIYYYMISAE